MGLDADAGAEPLIPVTVPEAGEMPLVPGVILGNVDGLVERDSLLSTDVLASVVTLPVLFPRVVEMGTTVGVAGSDTLLVRVGKIVR